LHDSFQAILSGQKQPEPPRQPELPGLWNQLPSDRPRSRPTPAQPPTNITQTPTPSLTPTSGTEPAPAIILPVPAQARSFTTVNDFRQIAPSLADALFELRLFVGTGVDATGAPTFELNRPLNRMEALALVIRLMGLEERALAFTGTAPFVDTPDWGSSIAAFAYNEGITAGTGDGLFTPERMVTYQEFTAFLLRVLGYSELNGDFLFEQALDKAVNIGLYSENQRSTQESVDQYLRSDAVLNMVNALLTNTKDSSTSLIDTLGMISRQAAIRFVADIGDIIRF